MQQRASKFLVAGAQDRAACVGTHKVLASLYPGSIAGLEHHEWVC
jgi:hypothetical protein